MSARSDYLAGRITVDEFERRIADEVRSGWEPVTPASLPNWFMQDLAEIDAMLKAAYHGPICP